MSSQPGRRQQNGERFWRSLPEYDQDPEFFAALEGEFPGALELWPDDPSRRAFLKRMAASLALAGVAGCLQRPQENIVPRVETPEFSTPGQSRVFATSMPVPGGAIGLLATSRDGRPTKLEGNPRHPASLGATDIHAQAAVLDLYDPDRSHVVRSGGAISNWPDFTAQLRVRMEAHRARSGAGLHILTGNVTSPTLLEQLRDLRKALPEARWHTFETFSTANIRAGTREAFGRELIPRYHIHNADVIFALDADFLGDGPDKLRLAREFARRRRVPPSGGGNFNRLYVAETTPSLTGAAADHRLPLPPERLAAVLPHLAKRLGIEVETADDSPIPEEWLSSLVDALNEAGPRFLVVVGPAQPPELHALAHAMNEKLGSIGSTVEFIPPVDRPEGLVPGSIADLSTAIENEQVETLLILGINPAYAAPAELNFADKLRRVPFTIHHGLYWDETARLCGWHVPATHFLESWSDARSEDGTASLIQPLIQPLYNGKSAHELLSALQGQPDRPADETIRATWKAIFGEAEFQQRWNQSLHDGLIEGTASMSVEVVLHDDFQPAPPPVAESPPSEIGQNTVQILFRPDPNLFDGRYANNGWLQELPKPFTKLTWGNAALLSPRTAEAHGLTDGDVIELSANGKSISIPILRLPGQPDKTITLHTGHGRRHAGRNADGIGTDVTPLQTANSHWQTVATLRPTGEHVKLATTQHHFLMEGRHLVQKGTWDAFRQSPDHPPFLTAGEHPESSVHSDGEKALPTLYPEPDRQRPQWGMTINLGSCIGCNACVVACQAENNIPIVGPEEVRRGREMHWIRVDTYYSGEPDNPQTSHQPVPCMHCEHAPCEPVCPVAATTHSDEGLNEMTYNRCIGTRYCSNNCPYKVRRFNFLDYRKEVKETPVLQLLQNPEVTVRSRGVMEKCTYCVQRINAARIQASMDNREIRDGEVVTACQAACPAEAIVFGDIADPDSAVSREKSHPLNYALLGELNTRPRTTYLAALNNPDPRLNAQEGTS